MGIDQGIGDGVDGRLRAEHGRRPSYYTLFSLAPLLFMVISVAGLVFGPTSCEGRWWRSSAAWSARRRRRDQRADRGASQPGAEPGHGHRHGGLIIGATTVFAELQSELDRIWGAPCKDRPKGLWGCCARGSLSFGLIRGVGFLLLVSLVLSAALARLARGSGGCSKAG